MPGGRVGLVLAALLVFLLSDLLVSFFATSGNTTISYTEFDKQLDQGNVTKIEAARLLAEHRPKLETLAAALLEAETLAAALLEAETLAAALREAETLDEEAAYRAAGVPRKELGQA